MGGGLGREKRGSFNLLSRMSPQSQSKIDYHYQGESSIVHTIVWWSSQPFGLAGRSKVGLEPATSGYVAQLCDALTN